MKTENIILIGGAIAGGAYLYSRLAGGEEQLLTGSSVFGGGGGVPIEVFDRIRNLEIGAQFSAMRESLRDIPNIASLPQIPNIIPDLSEIVPNAISGLADKAKGLAPNLVGDKLQFGGSSIPDIKKFFIPTGKEVTSAPQGKFSTLFEEFGLLKSVPVALANFGSLTKQIAFRGGDASVGTIVEGFKGLAGGVSNNIKPVIEKAKSKGLFQDLLRGFLLPFPISVGIMSLKSLRSGVPSSAPTPSIASKPISTSTKSIKRSSSQPILSTKRVGVISSPITKSVSTRSRSRTETINGRRQRITVSKPKLSFSQRLSRDRKKGSSFRKKFRLN